MCSENRHVTTPAKDTAKHCYSENLHWLYSTHPRIRVSRLVWRSDRKAGEVARIVLPPPSCYASACEKTIDYHTLILFYKIKSNLAPAYLTELLPSPSHNSGHTFRKELYPVPLVKKPSSLSSFLPRSIILWNSLPSELQKSSSLSTFKSALKSHLCT